MVLIKNKPKNHAVKLEQIYDVALKVFGQYGFKKTNIEDISEELGMTKGNIYFYVKNKKDLYEKTVIHAVNMLKMYQISALLKETDIREAIVKASQAGFEIISKNENLANFIQKNPNIFDYTDKDFSPENYKAYIGILNSTKNFTIEVIKKGVAQKELREFDVEYLTDLLSRIYDIFIIKDFLPKKKAARQKATQEIIDFVLHGVVNHEKS
jgi:AcrR family transcriptional regulator